MPSPTRAPWIVACVLPLATSCSIRDLAANGLAGVMSSVETAYASDNDPELVAAALPFGLKTIEALLIDSPDNEKLLLSACRGYVQYSYAFVESEALYHENTDYEYAQHLRDRALNLYLRARDYGLRALELRYPGVGEGLRNRPDATAEILGEEDIPLMYWISAAWGSAMSVGLDRPDIVADVDAARALLRRALVLDEDYSGGALHEAMIVIEALPELMGGSPERAREHFARAIELSGGDSAGAYVSLASSISVGAQDREEFVRLMESALAIDVDSVPELRLANTISQKRARYLLQEVDNLFLQPID